MAKIKMPKIAFWREESQMFANLAKRVQIHLLEHAKLGTAGQLVYYDPSPIVFANGTLILAVHTTGAEKTAICAEVAWDSLSPELKKELEDNNIGFAVRQI